MTADDEAGVGLLDEPGRREATNDPYRHAKVWWRQGGGEADYRAARIETGPCRDGHTQRERPNAPRQGDGRQDDGETRRRNATLIDEYGN